MKSTYLYCNNCGKHGHIFQNCKKPIISSGIIAFRKVNNEFQYLMIRRKDTLGYVDFMRGKYPVYNKLFVKNLINEMTIEEKDKIKTSSFKKLWSELWGEYIGLQYRSEESYSEQRFNTIKQGIDGHTNFDLVSLINDSKTTWTSQEWGFPKGRRNSHENDMKCAIREFEEETGIPKNKIDVIQNIIPLEEVFIGSNFKSYKHKYFVAQIKDNDININKYQESEVSGVKWVGLNDIDNYIRGYNLEKKNILLKVQNLLEKYSLIL